MKIFLKACILKRNCSSNLTENIQINIRSTKRTLEFDTCWFCLPASPDFPPFLPPRPDKDNPREYLRGLDRSWFHHHFDLVLGAGQQLDGARLSEPSSVRLEEHRAVVRKHLQGNPDFDDLGNVGHISMQPDTSFAGGDLAQAERVRARLKCRDQVGGGADREARRAMKRGGTFPPLSLPARATPRNPLQPTARA